MATTKKTKIGWIGLGHMGIPMSSNILKAGFDLTVYNRTADKTKTLVEKGAKAVTTIGELCDSSEIIFTMLSDDQAVKDTFVELVRSDVNQKLFINMSTVSPDTAKEMAQLCATHNAAYLDAPVSGSIAPATDGSLIILVGGSDAAYERAIPLFETLGKLSLLLGEVGAGSSAKLAINYYLAITMQGLAETAAFAQSNGISKECMMLIINEGACASPISKLKTPSIINNYFPAAFPLKHMAKDLRLAADLGLQTPMSEAIDQTFQSALSNGLGDEDVMAVIKMIGK